ncbi:MAG: hypothetical protein HY811_12255 [Planctomycetes bacterium]|nr:hypothetical protein [Planctomycetota bacterium]
MKTIALAKRLASAIRDKKRRFRGNYKYESDLEKEVYSIFRRIIKAELNLNDNKKLNDIIITHGETKPEKDRWTATKPWQDVIIKGCHNTSDIVIRLPKSEQTIAIQLKYAKDNITGHIQTVVGQCLIASLGGHSAVIGIVVSRRKFDEHHKKGKLKRLVDLLRQHNIFLVVRKI